MAFLYFPAIRITFNLLKINRLKTKLTSGQRAEIMQLHRDCRNRKFTDKLKAIRMLDDGFSYQIIGKIPLLNDDTIRGYSAQYLNDVAAALNQDRNNGT